MSSDDEDELCRFGTPLDPIEEDEMPTAKKITLADQIAVDSNGRRRFHGAFTGGFSAGFWNTVGSREGWVPSEFKSSRNEKAARRVQQASDFMDEEDVGEFGIAPQRIQTTDDFGPDARQRNKRKLESDATASHGPIPGVPVLELVLETCHDKAAVRLLKRMDKRYAATLTEKPKKSFSKPADDDVDEPMSMKESDEPANSSTAAASDAETADQNKVYKCDMGPIQRPKSRRNDSDDSNSGTDDDVDDYDENDLVFDTDEYDTIFNNLKSNRFGLSYVGLEKGDFFTTVGSEVPNIQNNFSILPTFSMVDQNRKKVTIRGQAFGVGAFEEDDDDIYGRDDMTKYDFRLDKQKESGGPSKSARNVERGYIGAFTAAKQTPSRITTKNVFRVHLPYGYEPRNWLKRKSRFGPETLASTSSAGIKGPADKVIGRHDLTPDQRGQILGDKKKETTSISDIDAKLKAAGLKTMSFTSGGVENKSDDSAAPTTQDLSSKIDETLSKFRNKTFVVPESIPEIGDRFTTSNDTKPLSELDSLDSKKSAEIPAVVNAPKEVQKVIRTKSTWIPCQLLCYKMNMESNAGAKPEKGNTFSLFECIANTESARRNRLEFTSVRHDERAGVFESKKIEERLHEKSQQVPVPETSKVPQQPPPPPPQQQQRAEPEHQTPVASSIQSKPTDAFETTLTQIVETKPEIPIAKRIKPKTELEMKILQTQGEHPSKKKDIFKAIFDSSGESEDSDNDDVHAAGTSKAADATVAADVLASLTKPSTAMSSMYSQLPDDAFRPKSAREINILRNTSPPRGIFSGLIKKSEPPPPPTAQTDVDQNEPVDSNAKSIGNDEPESDMYGPSLPPPKFSRPQSTATASSSLNGNAEKSAVASISLGKHSDVKVVYKEKWIEKTDEKEKKSKKEKKHKKDRDKHKSKKQKREKHKKKKR